jgi:adenylate cyclase
VGRALNVATVLDGSVRKAGNRVRIGVQLVNASDGYHLWSDTYDRTLDDVFAVQDDIARSVVIELRKALLDDGGASPGSDQARAEVAAAIRGRRTDPEAYDLFLRGKHLLTSTMTGQPGPRRCSAAPWSWRRHSPPRTPDSGKPTWSSRGSARAIAGRR